MDPEIERIKKLLNENHEWPSLFMFKFVVPSENEKIAKTEALVNSETAEIRLRPSSKGNYTAVTIRVVMVSAQAVLDVYAEARKIDGLIAL
jgi:putative lipoic acid-binding regulatory protein